MTSITPNPTSPYYTVYINSSRHGNVEGNLPQQFGYRLYSSWASLLGQYTATSMLGKYGPVAEFGLNLAGRSSLNQYNTVQTWTGNSPLEIMLPLQFFSTSDAESEVIKPIETLSKMLLPGIDDGGFFLPPGPGPAKQVSSTSTQGPVAVGSPVNSDSSSTGLLSAAKATVSSVVSGLSNTATDTIASATKSFSEGNILDGVFAAPGALANYANSQVSSVTEKYRDNITVKIGNFIRLDTVILVGLDVEYSGDMSPEGFPMSATATAIFRTLYTLSSDDLSRMMIRGSSSSLLSGITGQISSVGSSVSTIIETSPNTFDVGVASIDQLLGGNDSDESSFAIPTLDDPNPSGIIRS